LGVACYDEAAWCWSRAQPAFNGYLAWCLSSCVVIGMSDCSSDIYSFQGEIIKCVEGRSSNAIWIR